MLAPSHGVLLISSLMLFLSYGEGWNEEKLWRKKSPYKFVYGHVGRVRDDHYRGIPTNPINVIKIFENTKKVETFYSCNFLIIEALQVKFILKQYFISYLFYFR